MASRFAPAEGWSAPEPIDRPGDDGDGDAEHVTLAMDRGGNAVAVWTQAAGDSNLLWANRFVPGDGWAEPVRIDGNASATGHPRVSPRRTRPRLRGLDAAVRRIVGDLDPTLRLGSPRARFAYRAQAERLARLPLLADHPFVAPLL